LQGLQGSIGVLHQRRTFLRAILLEGLLELLLRQRRRRLLGLLVLGSAAPPLLRGVISRRLACHGSAQPQPPAHARAPRRFGMSTDSRVTTAAAALLAALRPGQCRRAVGATAAGRGHAGRAGVRPGVALRPVRPSAAAVGISVRALRPSSWPSPGLGSTNVLGRARAAETAGWRVFCTTKAFSMTGASVLCLREPGLRSLSQAGRVEGRAEWGVDGGQAPGRGTVCAQSCGDALGSGCAAPGRAQSAKVTLSGSAPTLS